MLRRFQAVTSAQSSTPGSLARIASRTWEVRPQTGKVAAVAASLASPSVLTARTWKVCATPALSPVTVTPASLAPPGALSSIGVHVEG